MEQLGFSVKGDRIKFLRLLDLQKVPENIQSSQVPNSQNNQNVSFSQPQLDSQSDRVVDEIESDKNYSSIYENSEGTIDFGHIFCKNRELQMLKERCQNNDNEDLSNFEKDGQVITREIIDDILVEWKKASNAPQNVLYPPKLWLKNAARSLIQYFPVYKSTLPSSLREEFSQFFYMTNKTYGGTLYNRLQLLRKKAATKNQNQASSQNANRKRRSNEAEEPTTEPKLTRREDVPAEVSTLIH